MGVEYSGGIATATRSIKDNLPNITIPYNQKTKYFGTAGTSSKVREVYTKAPARDAQKFFATLTYGGVQSKIADGNGTIAKMADGTVVTFRPTTKSVPFPGVDISIRKVRTPEVKAQKIHFMYAEED